MAIVPLKVNVRGLFVRRTATALTMGGIGLIIMVFVIVWGMSAGIVRVFSVNADPKNLLLLREGSNAETNSGVTREQLEIVASQPGIDRGADGKPLASGELYLIMNHERRATHDAANLTVRGVTPAGVALRPHFRIVEGRMFERGRNEVVTSRGVANRFQGCALGETLVMKKTPYAVVGTFSDDGSPYESEVWGDTDTLGANNGRIGYSSILVRASDDAARSSLAAAVKSDPRLSLEAIDQKKYFADQMQSAGLLQTLGTLMTFFLGIGACFSAANTMYASVLSRAREIGTLRALGFGRGAILVAYVLEAIVLSLLSGALGVALGALALTLYTGHLGTSNWVTFSEVVFDLTLTPMIVVTAMVVSAVIGGIGGLMPAMRAARMPIVEAIRAE